MTDTQTATITVEVNAPNGLPPVRSTLFVEPQTATEFEAVVAAAGGPGRFRYYSGDHVTADLDGGHTLFVYQPKSEGAATVVRFPFMAAFSERIAEAKAEAGVSMTTVNQAARDQALADRERLVALAESILDFLEDPPAGCSPATQTQLMVGLGLLRDDEQRIAAMSEDA